ncbi:MAG: phospholipase [Acidimicrobiia bacterium]|nr:phospholipase [Acidimicrobiia bacterium]
MRRIPAAVVAVLLAVTTLLLAPAVAGAQTEVDGCTAVPDSGRTFDFTEACLDHDRCYLERPHGDSSDDRRQCDRDFYVAMVDQCESAWPDRSDVWSRRACRAVAGLYYIGVRWFGAFAWDVGTDAPVAA